MVPSQWTRALACALALLGAGCDSGPAAPPAGFPFASATPECGPADGPAVTIYLTSDSMPGLPPSGPWVRVYLWHGLDELRGRNWEVGGGSTDGAAEFWDGGEATLLRGTATITTVGPDSTVAGDVDLVSGAAFTVRGGFQARWIPRALLCG